MPDYFVALDTATNSSYANRLVASNTIREYTLDFRDTHPELEEMGFERFNDEFEVSDKILDDVIDLGKKNGVRFRNRDYKKSKELIAYLIKARIARDFFGDDAFYEIYNNTNEVYIKAVELFNNPALLKNESNTSLLITR